MGRSVDYPSNASFTFFFAVPEWFREEVWTWQEYIDQITDLLEAHYPSVTDCDRWRGREQHVIAENSRGEFVLCVYCGLASLSFVPTDNLGAVWGSKIRDGLLAKLKATDLGLVLRKIATMSNGEGVYEAA